MDLKTHMTQAKPSKSENEPLSRIIAGKADLQKPPSSPKSLEANIQEYKAILASIPDAVIRKAWFTMAHLILKPGAKIIDIGCSEGAMTFAMAVMNPDYQFIGVDRDRHIIRQARDLYQLQNLEFICADINDDFFPTGSADAIINSFVLHEVYSHENCNELAVQDIIHHNFKLLKNEGYVFIRDFSLPYNGFVLLEMPDEKSHPENGIAGLSEPDLLIQYAEKARPHDDPAHKGFYLEELPPRFPQTRLFRLPYKWAYEFVLRKDDREFWEEELHKEYAFCSEQDMRRMLKLNDARVLYTAPHWDTQILKTRFEKKFKLFDEDGKLLGNPPTSFITLAQKVGERKSLVLQERKPSRSPLSHLRVLAMRDEVTGTIQDIVTRDSDLVEVLPYRIDEHNTLKIVVHKDVPRALMNAVPRNGPNIDGKSWSGHMIEPITVPLEAVQGLKPGDVKGLMTFARDFLGLKAIPDKDLEDGPGFFPAPDYIDERIQTKYIAVQKQDSVITPRFILEETQGFSGQGSFEEVDAQRILNAIAIGLIPSSRLEIQILALYEKLGLSYESWSESPLNLQTQEPEQISKLRDIVDKLAMHDTRHRDIRGTAGQLKTAHSVFVDEGQIRGGVAGLASKEVEFILQEDRTQNTAVILPLTRTINEEVMAGIIEDYLPVPQRYKGNGFILTCPSFNLPKDITNFELARKYIADKFEVPMECVSRMGESFFSHIGITPQRIYPFAVSTAGVKGWRKMGRGHGVTSFTPLKNLWKMLYWDNHDSFLKVAGYAYTATVGRGSDLSPQTSFSKKLAEAKGIPVSLRSSLISHMPSSKLARDG